jgi:hypothetical protein
MGIFPKLKIGDAISPPFFHGAFENLESLPKLEYPDGFESNEWVITALVHLYNLAQHGTVDHHLLPFFKMVISRLRSVERLSILDFGGGVGDNYIQLKKVLPSDLFNKVQYTIIDKPGSIDVVKSLHKDVRCFCNVEQAVTDGEKYDLALFSGVLMFVENSPELIKSIKKYFGCDIYITRTLFTDTVPTYTTVLYISPGDGPFLGKFIGVSFSTIWNSQLFFEQAEIPREHILIFHGYEKYNAALQNLPPKYRDAKYYTIYISNDESSHYNTAWYNSITKS